LSIPSSRPAAKSTSVPSLTTLWAQSIDPTVAPVPTTLTRAKTATTYNFVPPHPFCQSIASSIHTKTTSSNPGYNYSHSASSNASQTRLWTSDSTSSSPQQPYPSPLRHSIDTSLGGRASDHASNRDSRLWIDRSPSRSSSRFGIHSTSTVTQVICTDTYNEISTWRWPSLYNLL
jgi:hypothetical protein